MEGWMDKQTILHISREFVKDSNYNYVLKDAAILKELIGMQIFDEPIFAFGSADDYRKRPAFIDELQKIKRKA